jgi:hypothetical protein
MARGVCPGCFEAADDNLTEPIGTVYVCFHNVVNMQIPGSWMELGLCDEDCLGQRLRKSCCGRINLFYRVKSTVCTECCVHGVKPGGMLVAPSRKAKTSSPVAC